MIHVVRHLPAESLSEEETFRSSPLLEEGVSDLALSEPVLPIGLFTLDLNSCKGKKDVEPGEPVNI